MNQLQSYSSDEESGGEVPIHKMRKNSDLGTNYDDVGMDISEDSDDETVMQNAQTSARDRNRPPMSSAQPPGGPPTHGQHMDKTQTEGKETQRSSLQERLLGLASGGSSRSGPDDRGGVRDRRDSGHGSSPHHNGDGQSRRRTRSKSPRAVTSSKSRSHRDHSPSGSSKNNHRTRSRSRSRERDRPSGRGDRGHSGSHGGRGRDGRRGRDDDRKRRDDERRSRRSRSRSRSRERRRSRSRSRDRRSRSRSRDRRHRSRSRERKRPMDIRKEAQQKLAALKAANPDLTAAELLKRSMEAQVMEVQKQTGITLPSYYNPAAMNPMKFAEQERKKKLLWGNKSKPADSAPTGGFNMGNVGGMSNMITPNIHTQPPPTPHPALRPSPLGGGGFGGHHGGVKGQGGAAGGPDAGGQAQLWANTKFSNDRDGKMAEKFRRLMGVKSGEAPSTSTMAPKEAPPPIPTTPKDTGMDLLQKQETMFMSMERQYEMARIATHTHKGFGLGFTSQSFVPK